MRSQQGQLTGGSWQESKEIAPAENSWIRWGWCPDKR